MKYKTNKICDSRHFIPKSYVLKNTNSKSDNNKRILAPNDYIKQHFLCSNLMSWPGLCESDIIKQIITLTVITLSGAYCMIKCKEQNQINSGLHKVSASNLALYS